MNFVANFFEQIDGIDLCILNKNSQNNDIEVYFFQGKDSVLCIDKKSNKILYKINYNALEINISNKNGLTFNINGLLIYFYLKNQMPNKRIKDNPKKNYNYMNNDKKKNNAEQNKNHNMKTNQYNEDKQKQQYNEKKQKGEKSFSNIVPTNDKEILNKFNTDPTMENSILECKYPYMTVCSTCQNKKCSQYDILNDRKEFFNFGEGEVSEDLYKQFDNYCKEKIEKFKCNNNNNPIV